MHEIIIYLKTVKNLLKSQQHVCLNNFMLLTLNTFLLNPPLEYELLKNVSFFLNRMFEILSLTQEHLIVIRYNMHKIQLYKRHKLSRKLDPRIDFMTKKVENTRH